MELSDKIIALRKSEGMSQEDLAEQLSVSRQAVSRWESGSAMPNAANILQMSKLFGVSADYLLNDDYEEYQNKVSQSSAKEKEDNTQQILIMLITLEVMVLLIQFMCTFILQNIFFAGLSFILFVALIGGFEYAYQKNNSKTNEKTALFRKKFYKISAWLGLYFPVRFFTTAAMHLYPRPYSSLVLECIILVLYIGIAFWITLTIEERYLKANKNEPL